MKTPLHTLFLFILTLLFAATASAQPKKNQVFAAAGYVGANLGQIDGDYYFGYNKPGLRFGVETQFLFSPKSFLSVGLGFTQTGAKPTRRERSDRKNRTINLTVNNIEIPVLYNYRLGPRDATGKKDDYKLFRSMTVQGGLSLSRTAGYRIDRSGRISDLPRSENFASVEDDFEQFDLHLLVGVTIPMGLRTSLMIQHNKSMLGLYRPEVSIIGSNTVLPLFPYYLTFGVKYTVY